MRPAVQLYPQPPQKRKMMQIRAQYFSEFYNLIGMFNFPVPQYISRLKSDKF